jgi:hypothetical protein
MRTCCGIIQRSSDKVKMQEMHDMEKDTLIRQWKPLSFLLLRLYLKKNQQ